MEKKLITTLLVCTVTGAYLIIKKPAMDSTNPTNAPAATAPSSNPQAAAPHTPAEKSAPLATPAGRPLSPGHVGPNSSLPSAPQSFQTRINLFHNAAYDDDEEYDYAAEFAKPATRAEQRALRSHVQRFFKYVQPGATPRQLVRDLYRAGLEPVSSAHTNEETGTLTIVRTEGTLPGTRYFHAQFMTDENGKPYLQHMSFEFRPGPDSMEKAILAVQDTFNLRGAPSTETPDFREWHKDGRTLWIKRVTDLDELKSDHFNARGPEDRGVIVVGFEDNPHDHKVVREHE